jgi:hypothetical protein
MQEWLRLANEDMVEMRGGLPLNVEPTSQLVEYKPEGALGLGVYDFDMGEKGKISTIWDLREKSIPKLKYNG